MSKLYTIGYAAQGAMSKLEELTAQGVLIVDVRYNPSSKMTGYNERWLKEKFGKGYGWLQALGNVNHHTGKPIQLLDEQKGLAIAVNLLVTKDVSICLLCGCMYIQTCHRRYIAARLSERIPGLEVVHLLTYPCSMVACGNVHTFPCVVCGWHYCKMHTHFYRGRAYCADHIPPNDTPLSERAPNQESERGS